LLYMIDIIIVGFVFIIVGFVFIMFIQLTL